MPPRKVTALRSATDMLVAITPRSSSASAVSRETSSPLRVRSKKPASSETRCAYSCPRRSATTRSPRRETKKKRAAVASANATATANSSMKARSIAPPPPWANPWSIMIRNACGRVRVAVEEAARATSQAVNSPRWRRGKGQSGFRLPMGALAVVRGLAPGAGSGCALPAAGEAAFIRLLSAIGVVRCMGDADLPARGVAQLQLQRADRVRRHSQQQTPAIGRETLGQLVGPVLCERRVHCAGVFEGVRQPQVDVLDERAARGRAQAFGGAASVGAHEASGAQLDPPVPAGDHHHHLVQALAIDGRQDRPPRGAGGLAVVAGAVQPPDPP